MSDGTWIVGDPNHREPEAHRCAPPDCGPGSRPFVNVYAVWQCPCGARWESVVSERIHPYCHWRRTRSAWWGRIMARKDAD